jgi:hypothetical protein
MAPVKLGSRGALPPGHDPPFRAGAVVAGGRAPRAVLRPRHASPAREGGHGRRQAPGAPPRLSRAGCARQPADGEGAADPGPCKVADRRACVYWLQWLCDTLSARCETEDAAGAAARGGRDEGDPPRRGILFLPLRRPLRRGRDALRRDRGERRRAVLHRAGAERADPRRQDRRRRAQPGAAAARLAGVGWRAPACRRAGVLGPVACGVRRAARRPSAPPAARGSASTAPSRLAARSAYPSERLPAARAPLHHCARRVSRVREERARPGRDRRHLASVRGRPGAPTTGGSAAPAARASRHVAIRWLPAGRRRASFVIVAKNGWAWARRAAVVVAGGVA